MSDRPWHKRYHGNAITGYMGLSLEERGAYSTLLDYLYDRRAPLPNNMRLLAGYLDISVRKAEGVIDSLMKKGKLYRRENGTISNRRFEKELENDARVADHMAAIGSKGGRISADGKKNAKENKAGRQRTVQRRSSFPEPDLEPEGRKKDKIVPTPKAPAPPRKARQSVPDEFPSKEAKAAAVLFWNKRGRPDLSAAVDDQAEKFRDHHAANGKVMADWPAAWRYWIRNSLEITRPPRHTLTPVPSNAAAIAPDTATWLRRLEYFDRGNEEEGVDRGYWSVQWGPKPSQPGCKVPSEAFAAYAVKWPKAGTGGS